MTDADYADDLVFLANTLAYAKPLLHRLKHAAEGTDFCVSANKTEYMCFEQEGTISSLSAQGSKISRPVYML